MTDMTRVFAFKDEDGAAQAAGYWTGLGYHVAVAGPTDAIRLSNGSDPAAIWESGDEIDWILVIASKAKIELIAAATE